MIVLLSLFSLAAVERRDAANWHESQLDAQVYPFFEADVIVNAQLGVI